LEQMKGLRIESLSYLLDSSFLLISTVSESSYI